MRPETPPPARGAKDDAKVVALPGRGAPAGATRDPRIDFFRGLALMMILVNHMPGNPWEVLTIRNIGFSDAAEAFFIMSGIAVGIAYSPGVARWLESRASWREAVLPMWRRAWTLYLVQMLLTVFALGLYAWASDTFLNPRFRIMHNLGLAYSETARALAGIPTLGYQIGYVNILPGYIALMLVAPLIVIGGLRWPRRTLAVAVAVWFVGGLLRLNIPNHPGGGGWFLSPFSWQLIFAVGVLAGICHRQGRRLVPVHRGLLALALGFLVLVLAWRHIPDFGAFMNHQMSRLGKLGAPHHVVSHNKTFLAVPRLAHALALFYVLSCLPAVSRIAAHRLSDPLRLVGRHGLLVFALGTVLALSGQITMDVMPDEVWPGWLLPPAAICVSWLAARLAEAFRAPARNRRPVEGTAPEPALRARA